MGRIKFTERRFALLCAAVLIGVSIGAIVREQYAAAPDATGQNAKISSLSKEQPKVTDTAPAQEAIPVAETPAAEPQPMVEEATPKTESEPALEVKTEPKAETTAEAPKTPQATSTKNAESYGYVAVAGSSYTEFARTAINTYAEANDMNPLSSQILNAEVALANAAGSPLLEIGQTVGIAQNAVAEVLRQEGVSKSTAAPVATPPATSEEKTDVVSKETKGADYTVRAVVGDSYVSIARTAIAQYIQQLKMNMTGAQKVAAETMLAEGSEWPAVDINEQITITNEVLQTAVSSAAALDATAQSPWQQYALQAGLS